MVDGVDVLVMKRGALQFDKLQVLQQGQSGRELMQEAQEEVGAVSLEWADSWLLSLLLMPNLQQQWQQRPPNQEWSQRRRGTSNQKRQQQQ